MEAKVGEAAEVPPMETGSPERKMRKRSAWAATSGMACGDAQGLSVRERVQVRGMSGDAKCGNLGDGACEGKTDDLRGHWG